MLEVLKTQTNELLESTEKAKQLLDTVTVDGDDVIMKKSEWNAISENLVSVNNKYIDIKSKVKELISSKNSQVSPYIFHWLVTNNLSCLELNR